jgi:hypothetical protein
MCNSPEAGPIKANCADLSGGRSGKDLKVAAREIEAERPP